MHNKTEEFEKETDFEQAIKTIIEECLEKQPGARWYVTRFRDMGISTTNLDVAKIIKNSLQESLSNKDDLHTIALKVTLLHDFPQEVGGGGYSGAMHGVPELRKQLIGRLLQELASADNDLLLTNQDFKYVFKRISADWDPIASKKQGLDQIPEGNQRTKAILEKLLGWMDDES